MKWFNAILRYSLIIMVVVAIAIAYVYRHQLFPAFFEHHHVESNDLSTQTADTNMSQGMSASTGTSETEVVADTAASSDQKNQPQTATEPEIVQSPKSETESQGNGLQQDKQVVIDTNSQQALKQDSAATAVPQQQDSRPATNGPVNNTTQGSNQSQAMDLSQAYNDQMKNQAEIAAKEQHDQLDEQQRYMKQLNNARQAYWQRDYSQSIESYQQALDLRPDNPDIHGELGNVYYSQGEWEKAGESYYQAAVRLIEKNRPDRAHNLLSVISGLKKERATELQQQLESLRQRQYSR